jgi:benzoate membrane transport protein
VRLSVIIAAVVAALVGFGGTLAIIVAAARAVGADAGQTSSWLAALCLAMAVTSPFLSWRHRIPVITAWSTPGAALVAASGSIGLNAAVGAFFLAAALVVLTAAFRPIAALIERIPTSIAAAMLAGVLLRFVLAVLDMAQVSPELVLPLVGIFLLVRLASPAGAVLAVLAAGVALTFLLGLGGPLPAELRLSTLTLVLPAFEPSVLVGLGLPLFLVTMASQNLPGFAVLRAYGYPVPARSILAVTGLASLATAGFGAHTSNLAAITAAICTGPDVHPDPRQRWLTGPVYGLCYALLALFGASLVGLFAALPPALVTTVAGAALVAPLAGALGSALADERQRFPAVLAFAVTASGVTASGIGAPFWGLVAGLFALALDTAARRWRPAR